MYLLRIMAGTIFNLIGVLVLYKGIKICRSKGMGEGFIDLIISLAFILIGLLVWTGFIA
jgi:hypothetical protein